MARRNHLFDAMRGIVAILVVTYHFGERLGHPMVAGGYLAVDFFFILSGFVIGSAYEPRLRAGLAFGSFVRSRLIRLYPAYFVAFVLGTGWIGLTCLATGAPTAEHVLTVAGFNAVMLPAPTYLRMLFPSNLPAWSLFAEFVVNLVYAALLFRLRSRYLLVVVVLCAAITAVVALTGGEALSFGWNWATLFPGLARTGASFGIGVLIARQPRGAAPPAFVALLLTIGLVAALLLPVPPGLRPFVDLGLAFVAFPLLIWGGAAAAVPRAVEAFADRLGAISYPLYALHIPVLVVVMGIAPKLHLTPGMTAALAVVAVAAATIFYTFIVDGPLRRWFGAVLQPESRAPSAGQRSR